MRAHKAAMSPQRLSLREILMATDFSSTSEKALKYAVSIASRYNSKIHLVHVIEPTVYEFIAPEAMEPAFQQLRRAAQEQLQEEAKRLEGVRHETFLESGAVWEVVEGLVRTHHIDLIVAGTHGAKGVAKLVLGSTAEEIFRRATCPVLNVGPRAHDSDALPQLNRILFPVNLASDATAALSYAASLAAEYKARLTLVHVLADVKPPVLQEASVAEPYVRQLRRLVPSHADLLYQPDYRIEYGKAPADAILAVAKQMPADLIVLGVRPAEPWASHFSDKASRIVAEDLCPVLTIRAQRSSAGDSQTGETEGETTSL